MKGDKTLDKFRQEYEKLHKALKKSHESEKRLMQKTRELNAEITANSAKVATALKLSQEDQNQIQSLKKEIEKAWKTRDAAYEKETRARETIQQLKMEIANLSKLVEQGAGLTMGQEHRYWTAMILHNNKIPFVTNAHIWHYRHINVKNFKIPFRYTWMKQ